MTDPHELRQALRREADRLGAPGPLRLDDVKGRARGIRRRRIAVSGLAAAAVVAVAVPVGLSGVVDRSTPSERPSPPVAASPTPAAPADPLGQALTTTVPRDSAAPGVPWLDSGRLVLPDGRALTPPAGAESAAVLGDGFAVVARNDVGQTELHVLDEAGEELFTAPTYGPVATSADGTVVVWATPEGNIRSLGEGQTKPVALPSLPPGPGQAVEVVGILGSGSCDPDGPGGGCAVYLTQGGDTADPVGGWITSRGIGGPLDGARAVTALSPSGDVAVLRSVTDEGSCSALLGQDLDGEQWTTCKHTLGAFSPDGAWLIGWPAYRDGIGDGSIAILDAATGRPVASWENSGRTTAFVADATWDGDSVLATVYAEGSWSVLRFRPDGSAGLVAGDLGGDMDHAPARF